MFLGVENQGCRKNHTKKTFYTTSHCACIFASDFSSPLYFLLPLWICFLSKKLTNSFFLANIITKNQKHPVYTNSHGTTHPPKCILTRNDMNDYTLNFRNDHKCHQCWQSTPTKKSFEPFANTLLVACSAAHPTYMDTPNRQYCYRYFLRQCASNNHSKGVLSALFANDHNCWSTNCQVPWVMQTPTIMRLQLTHPLPPPCLVATSNELHREISWVSQLIPSTPQSTDEPTLAPLYKCAVSQNNPTSHTQT